MAITPSTSLQSFTINKYTTSESGGTGNSCPSTLYLEVQHKITSTSGNKTYLQVTLILHHAQINLGAGSNDCYISINGEETYWTGPDLYSTTSGKTTTLGTKTIEIEHDSNGTFTNKSFIVRYRFNATYSGVSVKYITNNYTNSTQNTITLPALYSACTAPTSVSASGIIKPRGSFTVSWSGASGGTNNSITGYRVYYNISSNGAAPTTSTTTYVDVSSTATSGSTTITLSTDATRKHKIVCGVVTKGSAGSSFYSGIKTGGSVTINSLPAKPTVSASATVIPSSGSRAITFTVTPGGDDDSSQTRTVRYAKTNDSQTTAITSGTSITFSAATTVSFWTYDGLEYSEEATTISITKNTAPTISSFSASVGTFTAFNTSGVSNQFRGWADYMTPTITTNKPSGTINRTIEFAKLNSISNFSPDKTINYTSETISSTSSTLSKISPYSGIISAYGTAVDTTYKYIAWRIKYTFNDGIETSAPAYYPTNTNYFYAIPGMSPVNSKSVNDGALFKNISFTLYNETVPSGGSSLTTSVTATIDGQTVPVSKTESTSGNNRTLAVTLTNAPPSNKDVVFTISYVRGGLTKTVQSTIKSRTTPSSFGELSLSNSTLKPFTSNSDYLFSISWSAFAGCNTLDEVATNYNISSSNIKLLLTKNDTGTPYEVSATPSKVNDVLTLTKVGSSFYPWSNAWGISTYEKSHEYSVQIKATNGYGEVFLSGAKTFKVNFDEPITYLTITKFYRVYGTSSLQALWTSPSTKDSRGFAENNIGCIGLSYSGYTRDTCKVDVYFDGQLKKTFNISNAGKTGNSSYTMVHDSATSTSGDVVINVANEKFTIPEITKATTPVRIVVTNNYSSFEAEISNGMTTVKQTAPTISLNSLEINEDKFSGRVTVTDLGVTTNNTSSPYRISDGTSVYSSNFALTGSGTNYTFSNISRTGTDFDVKALTLQYTTTVTIYSNSGTGTTTSSKTYYLNYLTVYKASPTVAYRKNSVGINTTSPLTDAILDLHQSSTTTNVYFQGTYGEGTSTVSSLWTFDVSNGIIQYTRNTTNYTLDLTNLLTIGTTATTAAAGNHTHQTSIATSTATNQVTLGYGEKYSLTAGGTSYIFTMPSLGTNSSTAAAGNHTHGSITNAGAITSNTAIATSDRIVFSDNSDSSKLKRSTITFDTAVTNKYLSQAGTWADSLSTTTLTATGAISGASVSATGEISCSSLTASTIARGKYVDVSNTTTNGSQVRFRFSNEDDNIYGNFFLSHVNGGRFTFRQYCEDSDGNLLSTYEQFILPSPTIGRTDNAVCNILTSKGNGALTLTRDTTQSYVNATDFARITAYRRNGFYVIRGNLNISSSIPNSTNVTIGTISNYTGLYEAVINVPTQDGAGCALITITTAGVIKIGNYIGAPISGWCRFNIIVPTTDP